MHFSLENNTEIPIENKVDQIHTCIQKIFRNAAVKLVSITCDDIGYKQPNFTTFGIFRLHGYVKLHDECKPWCVVLKIIKPESAEKDNVAHHNYWRREALVFETGVLKELPNSISATESYLVEEQQDGTIWLWMEYVKGEYANTVEEFSYIARQLGRFNGAYLKGINTVPDHQWICKNWLKSWTTSCRLYAPNIEAYASRISTDNEQRIWTWNQELLENIDSSLETLKQLPHVLAHQDLSQMNMLLVKKELSELQLVLIDWQFMSSSGVGEDVGKLFGVNMSLGIIPPDQYSRFQTSLYIAYLEGLRDMGWAGNEDLVRYGFCLSIALRSVWEVPQFFYLLAQAEDEPNNHEFKERLKRLDTIITGQKQMALEADSLRLKLKS
ncbi:phosphotransferase [Aureibacillus halotolerans]|uniref:Phosphotransferase family enzyme n=1 Tax=Aureibacillus halotolerans TaxID=1508390 RepID=A0A4R6U402_9BACI|nr:phosphotransferase [Aureibacillus halotolerans]TDQ40416.1 phosphotransferase family enzyme [Aureibacillus halotolerans]